MLKEIGREKRHRDLVARIIVGLESGDPLIMKDYNQLMDDLDPEYIQGGLNLRHKLLFVINTAQQHVNEQIKEVGR